MPASSDSLPGQLPEPLWSRLLEVRDVLAFSFDFELFEHALGSDAYATPAPWLPAFVVPGANVRVVGRDLTGGAYVCCERAGKSCCLHIDTRGHAASLGESLEQALALLIALPYWPELLAECSLGQDTRGLSSGADARASALASMRELAVRLEREACDDLPDLPAARRELQSFLELPKLADPVLRLHELAALEPAPMTVWSPHGWRYESPLQLAAHSVAASGG